MSFLFTVSPDFTPDHLSGWYMFNTWLQRQTGDDIHLEIYDDFQSQRGAIQDDKVDLIYANPFDAAMLVREKNFMPLVKASNQSDEAMIAVNADSPVESVEQLKAGTKVAYTEDPGVQLMGMMMLEPAELYADNITSVLSDSYVLVAKQLMKNQADVGIFLAEAYDDLSSIVKKQMKVLVRSQISVIHHSLMAGPKLQHKVTDLQNILTTMEHDEKGSGILEVMKLPGWETVENEEMEFMIDLMDTLDFTDM